MYDKPQISSGVLLGSLLLAVACGSSDSNANGAAGASGSAGVGGSAAGASGNAGTGGGASGSAGTTSSAGSAGVSGAPSHPGTWYDCSEPTGACVGNSDITQTLAQSTCSAISGTIVDSCPTTGLIGCCTKLTCAGCGTPNQQEICYYEGYGFTLDGAQQECSTSMGNWSSGP
ncbi:MAG TPA: hypothetical protein VGI10_16505 [Polyangiaceae bacterium]|jgi:hypothetical protein